MKKEIPKIAVTFLVTVFAVVLGLNFIYFGQSPKSKAAGEIITFTYSPTSVNQNSGEFNVNVLLRSNPNVTFRGYKFDIGFDKDKISFKTITYNKGVVSSGLGDSSTNITAINQRGTIKVVGETQSPSGETLASNINYNLVTVTFTIKSVGVRSNITIGTSANLIALNTTNFSLFQISPTTQATLLINGGVATGTPAPTPTTDPNAPTSTPTPTTDPNAPTSTPTPTITPGGPTLTPTITPGGPTLTPTPTITPGGPTLTPTPTGGTAGVTLSFKLKFQGIQTSRYTDSKIKIMLAGGGLSQPKLPDRMDSFSSSDASGFWNGVADFNNVPPGEGYRVYIKGPFHIQKKICDVTPTELFPGGYRCSTGKITLQSGKTMLDLSGIYLLAGDLPVQDGIVNSYDASLVRNNLGKKDTETLKKADINLDGVVDTQDFSLIIAALSTRTDEE